jgi:hypothetical protein
VEVLWHGAPCRPRSPRPLSKQTVRCPALYLSPERRIVLSSQRNCETVHHSKERKDRAEKERVFKDPSKKGSGSKKAILGGVGSSKTRDLLCSVMPSSAPRVGLHCHLPLSACLCQWVPKSASFLSLFSLPRSLILPCPSARHRRTVPEFSFRKASKALEERISGEGS